MSDPRSAPGRRPTPATQAPRSEPPALHWTKRAFTIVIAASLASGIAAAAVGGPLTDLGDGAGGLFGVPSLLTTLIALFLGMPSAIIVARRSRGSGWLSAAIVVGAGAWVVAIGYFVVAHAVDPCVNGWWEANSRIGSQPLCERFGAELNWHTRFHLLAHAAPAATLLAIYLVAIRRWVPTGRAVAPDHADSAESPSLTEAVT